MKYGLWGDDGCEFETVLGHVTAAEFNAERDKHVDADPVEESELYRCYARFTSDGDDERCELVKGPGDGFVPVTVLDH